METFIAMIITIYSTAVGNTVVSLIELHEIPKVSWENKRYCFGEDENPYLSIGN